MNPNASLSSNEKPTKKPQFKLSKDIEQNQLLCHFDLSPCHPEHSRGIPAYRQAWPFNNPGLTQNEMDYIN
jgi:hypothetical protein